MATTIVTKNSSTASAVPTAAQLVQGELAVNVADKRIFTENNVGGIVELGTNPTSITTGNVIANGNVGIGTATPATKLDVLGVTSLQDSLLFTANTVGTPAAGGFIYRPASNTLAFGTASAERVRIDSTGKVGIGTATPLADLDVRNNISMGDGTSATNLSMTRNSANYISASNASGYLVFRTGGAVEAMRIDTTGNLLIGKTAANVTTVGTELRSNGLTWHTTNGIECLGLNRLTSDGKILDFRKDGTSVGSIGSVAGDMYLATGSRGIHISDAANSIVPCNETGGDSDATTSLGLTGTRFKDLHLSGQANVGTMLLNAANAKINLQSGIIGTTGAINWTFNTTGTVFGSVSLPYDTRASDGLIVDSGYPITLNSQNEIKFITGGTDERMRINSSGNVGIGTTSPSGLLDLTTTGTTSLDIQGGDGNSKNIVFRKTTGDAQQAKISVVGDELRFTTGPTTERMRINSAGVVEFKGGITEAAVTLTGTATTINLETATNFVHALTGATTYTFSNPATTGNVSAFTLKIIQDLTARTITWPSSVDWPGGTAPTLTATSGGVDIFTFFTHDGGITYYGFTAGQAMA